VSQVFQRIETIVLLLRPKEGMEQLASDLAKMSVEERRMHPLVFTKAFDPGIELRCVFRRLKAKRYY